LPHSPGHRPDGRAVRGVRGAGEKLGEQFEFAPALPAGDPAAEHSLSRSVATAFRRDAILE
jgi:hypothetical protein